MEYGGCRRPRRAGLHRAPGTATRVPSVQASSSGSSLELPRGAVRARAGRRAAEALGRHGEGVPGDAREAAAGRARRDEAVRRPLSSTSKLPFPLNHMPAADVRDWQAVDEWADELAIGAGRTQHCELVGDLELGACGNGRPRPAGRRPGPEAAARRSAQHAAAEQHALEVRGRDVVPERRRVQVAELRDRERRRREREAEIRVGELRAQALAAGERRSRRGRRRSAGARRPGASACPRVRPGRARWDEPEVGGRHPPALRVGARLQLLEVRELADVDLRGEVPPDRALERLGGVEPPAGQRPPARRTVARARRQSSTCSAPSRTCSTTATVSWLGWYRRR